MLNKKGNPDVFNQELKEFMHWLEEKGGAILLKQKIIIKHLFQEF